MPTTDLTVNELDRMIAAAWHRYAESKRRNWRDLAAAEMAEIDLLLEQRSDSAKA